MSIIRKVTLVVLAFTLLFIGAAPVHGVDREPPLSKEACKTNKDGTKDCSAVFIEVGQPVNDPGAVAATCSGYSCDGLNPYSAGCAVNYGVIGMKYIYAGAQQVGYVQVWWSNTCQTNWTRTVCTVSCGASVAQVIRDDNGNRVWDWPDLFYREVSYGSSVYSKMVFAPERKVSAIGGINANNNNYYEVQTGWY